MQYYNLLTRAFFWRLAFFSTVGAVLTPDPYITMDLMLPFLLGVGIAIPTIGFVVLYRMFRVMLDYRKNGGLHPWE